MHKFEISNIDKLDNPGRRKQMPPLETLQKFGIKESGTLLDIGCGIGYFTIPAAGLLTQGNAVGVDIIPEIIQYAREKSEGVNNIEFKVCREYSFPFESGGADYVLASNILHEVDDKVAYCGEIKRVLKMNGQVFIIEWDKRSTEMGPPVKDRISADEMIELFEAMGFELIEKINVSVDHYGLKFKLK